MKYVPLFALMLMLLNCKDNTSETNTKPDAKVEDKTKTNSEENLMDKVIEVAGVNKLNNATLEFDFRDKHFKAVRHNGNFALEREFKDDLGAIRDLLTNDGFERFVDAKQVTVVDSMIPKYSASVNSVHYFAVLPYGLDATSVNKELLDDVNIKGKTYHTIKVTFNQEGGGEDFDDEYLYWINAETNKIDYLAYSYKEDDGLGFRFREAYNERYVKGIRFLDYNNYKPKSNKIALIDMPKLFEDGELELLSKIETEHIKVTLQ